MRFDSLAPRLAPLAFVFAAACAGSGSDPGHPRGDVGDTSNTSALLGADCDRNQILAGTSGDRLAVLQRGFDWYDQQVPYSQSDDHDGYRTDCSGFVSMCWQLGTSYTTADFYDGNGDNSVLGSYDDLLPGDALVRRSGGEGHVVLFAGWQDDTHSAACVIEEESTALGMQFHARDVSAMQGNDFKPIRANSLANSGNTPDPNGSSSGGNPPDPNGGSSSGNPPDPNGGSSSGGTPPDPNGGSSSGGNPPDPNGGSSSGGSSSGGSSSGGPNACGLVGDGCVQDADCCDPYLCDFTGVCVDPSAPPY